MLRRFCLLALLVSVLGSLPAPSAAQPEPPAFPDLVSTLPVTETLTAWGNLGGVTIDRLGYIYVANFHDSLWRIAPDGETTLVSDAFYGASGNAVDSQGNLLQANFFGHTIDRIRRDGTRETLVDEGLSGPVGIAVAPGDTLYVCNCNANTVVKISPDGRRVMPFASGEAFACPNGLTFDPDGNLYLVNFSTDDVLRLAPDGTPSVVATLPAGGNAHIAFARGHLYVTKITTNQLYRVSLDGTVDLVTGTGTPGLDDGPAPGATLARPNGIAANATGTTLYLNNLDGEWNGGQRSKLVVRTVELATLTKALLAVAEDGAEAVERVYRQFKEARPTENTFAEAVPLGYRLLSGPNWRSGVALFQLNSASYPAQAQAHYHLGESYRFTGQTAQAIAAYEKVLELDPEHQNASNRLKMLRTP